MPENASALKLPGFGKFLRNLLNVMNLNQPYINTEDNNLTGYLNPGYAQSLAEFGKPYTLPRSKGWLLERQIPDTPYRDAMGCYPLFCCQNWSMLNLDLAELETDWVTLALVTDPFGTYNLDRLHQCFDLVTPFKEHFIIDYSRPIKESVSKNHQYQARKALKKIQVELCEEPIRFLDDWIGLYNVLIQRYSLRGIHTFSKNAFARQLSLPGITMLRAVYRETTVGILISYIQGNVGYAHLIATNETGYELGSSYALFWRTITHFADKLRWLSIGATAGLSNDRQDGLNFFKRGWSTGTRPTYFCGRIFDPQKYVEIVQAKKTPDTNYFPAYRLGEFNL